VPEIAEGRTISTLSTRNREKRLQEIRDAENAEVWKRNAQAWLEAEQRHHEEQQQHRAEELERLAHIAQAFRQYSEKSKETRHDVENALGTSKTEKVAEVAGRRWNVLGFRRLPGPGEEDCSKSSRVVLRTVDATNEQETTVVWATKGLEKILDGCADLFETSSQDKFKRTTYWLPPLGSARSSGLEIEIDPARVFHSRKNDCEIAWNPIRVVAAPDAQRLPILQILATKAQEYQTTETEQRPKLQETSAPKPKNTTKAIDLEPGEYVCRLFASTKWRDAPRTLLFLVPTGENGEAKTDVETPTYGHFLQKEVEALGGVEALRKTNSLLLCSLGAVRTTPQKRKCRLVSIAVA